ncbi:kelch-like protein 30 [Mercenaria mercenaria]|uniref:kelch-like protein 30 n=1 Tax=Mercenaria mercenaria TaxID=6596 RepID=UPI00234F56A9|nr:kelch-like protein 30 [Mercenaria mercenaria]
MSKSTDKDLDDEEFTIVVEGKSLTCQKSLLREKSEYFRAMMDSSMLESQTNTVTLLNQEFSVLSSLIHFVKTGELKISCGGGNMKNITEAAVMLQIESAIESCTAYWKKTLDHETCLNLMAFSKLLNLENLFSCAKRHSLYYFSQVRQSIDFLQMEVEELTEYLSCPDLNCTSETEILDAIMAWYAHDKPGRKSLLNKLIPCFHGEDVQQEEWEAVQNHKLINESEDWKTYINNIKEKGKEMKPEEKFRNLPVIILTFGGYIVEKGCEQPSTDICKFDDSEKTFKPFHKLKDIYPEVGPKMGYQVTVIGKDVYLSGGQLSMTRYSMVMDVWKLDGFDLQWEKVTKLSSPRRHHGACGSQTSLFIMGGFGKYRDILDTVQQYDTVDDKWTDLPKMPHTWFTPQAVCCENKLYVYKTHLICLDLVTLEWTTVRRTPCSVDNMNTFIPYYFNNCIYEFPFLDQELDWFYEFELGKLQLQKTSLETGKWEAVPYSDSIQFGNRSFVCNGKFYTINRASNEFICGYMQDFSLCKELGTQGKAGQDCFIVVFPHYPVYKIKS